jgi:hypothetical protein
MSNLTTELKDAGHVLTDEQKVQAVIRSLPDGWDKMKQILTHDEDIKTLSDLSKHILLEVERLEALKPKAKMHMIASTSGGGTNSSHGGKKRKDRLRFVNERRSKPEHNKRPAKKGGQQKKHFKKRNLSKIKCFQCNKLGHFARTCTEGGDKVTCLNKNEINVSSSIFLTESNPFWLID